MRFRCVALAFAAAIPALWLLLTMPAARAESQSAGGRATPPGTASLSGRAVTDAENPLPLRRVIVSLKGQENGVARSIVTSDDGRFVFENLPSGRYLVAASKAGYLDAQYGAARPGRSGAPIALGTHEHRDDLELRLIRGAVITGRVLDTEGEPASSQTVGLLQRRIAQGGHTFVPVSVRSAHAGFEGPSTDDRGVYRLYEVPPGEYVVVVGLVRQELSYALHEMTSEDVARMERLLREPPAIAPVGGLPQLRGVVTLESTLKWAAASIAYAPVYYPGVTRPSAATLLTIAAGEERSGIDLQIQTVRTATVAGTVVDAGGRVPPNVIVHVVDLDPQTARNTTGSSISVITDGRFREQSVAPGRYRVEARTLPRDFPGVTQKSVSDEWAEMEIVVDGADLLDLALTLRPTAVVTGRIELDGAPDTGEVMPTLQLHFNPETSLPGTWLGERAVTSLDGRFQITDLIPGRYRISATLSSGAPTNRSQEWVFLGATAGGRDVTDAPFEVRSGEQQSEVVVTMSRRRSVLAGALEDASGRPASLFSVVAFSTNRAAWYWQSRRIRSQRLADDGSFVMPDLPAGEYFLAALTDVEPDAWFDPEFLEALAPVAIRIQVKTGERTEQRIRIAR